MKKLIVFILILTSTLPSMSQSTGNRDTIFFTTTSYNKKDVPVYADAKGFLYYDRKCGKKVKRWHMYNGWKRLRLADYIAKG